MCLTYIDSLSWSMMFQEGNTWRKRQFATFLLIKYYNTNNGSCPSSVSWHWTFLWVSFHSSTHEMEESQAEPLKGVCRPGVHLQTSLPQFLQLSHEIDPVESPKCRNVSNFFIILTRLLGKHKNKKHHHHHQSLSSQLPLLQPVRTRHL